MSGTSNVGGSGVYEAGDQRTEKDSVLQEKNKEARYHEGQPNSHLANDSSIDHHAGVSLARTTR